MLIGSVIARVQDDELPPVIGFDFDVNGQASPTNWTQRQFFSDADPTDMLRNDGVATTVDLLLDVVSGSGQTLSTGGITDLSTIPQHNPSLSAIGGFVQNSNGTVRATWSDLNPNATYEVFVFAVENVAATFSQSVSIVGSTTLPAFDQVLTNGLLRVNDEQGSSCAHSGVLWQDTGSQRTGPDHDHHLT